MKILALHLLYHQRSAHLLPMRRFGSVHVVITDDAADSAMMLLLLQVCLLQCSEATMAVSISYTPGSCLE